MRATALVTNLSLLVLSLLPLGCSQSDDATSQQVPPSKESKEVETSQPAVVAPAPLRFGFDGDTDDRGVPTPWVPTVSAGTLEVAVVPAKAAEGGSAAKVLRMRTEKGSFLLTNRREFDPMVHRRLRWSWKATVLPHAGDVRKSALLVGENRNDQAVQLLVGFENNRVLSFVWDTTARRHGGG